VVKVGEEGWVDLEPVLLTICWVAKLVDILLDIRLAWKWLTEYYSTAKFTTLK